MIWRLKLLIREAIYLVAEKLDAKILDIDFEKRIIRLSQEHQRDEQDTLIKKFGKNASTSGQKLASILKTALGKKDKEKNNCLDKSL